MQNNINPFLKELIWLIFSLVFTFLFSLLLFGGTFLSGDLDLHFHDTYFVMSRGLILTPIFLFVFFLLYLIKEKRKSFSWALLNWLIIISGLSLIIMLTILIQAFSQIFTGWTLYPPLSDLGNSKGPEFTTNHIAKFIANFLIVVQLVVLTLLLYFAYCWGGTKNEATKGMIFLAMLFSANREAPLAIAIYFIPTLLTQ